MSVAGHQYRVLIVQCLQNIQLINVQERTFDLLKKLNSFKLNYIDKPLDFDAILPNCYEFNTNFINNW